MSLIKEAKRVDKLLFGKQQHRLNLDKLILGETRRKRIPISASVKKKVWERAKGRCEYPGCNVALKWGNKGRGKVKAIFHHLRDPSVQPTAKTVLLLCPNHHSIAHEYKTVKKQDLIFGERKVRKVIRKDVTKKLKKRKTSQRKKKAKSKRKKKETPPSLMDLML